MLKDTEQQVLFENLPAWTEQWVGMPDFQQDELMPWKSLTVHFRNREDRTAFSNRIEQRITDDTKPLWYPAAIPGKYSDKRYFSSMAVTPKYPIYVISKGRADTRLTSIALEAIKTPYRIVIEPQEYDEYAAVIATEKILTLPFSNLGQGSIPARNWVWDHALSEGHARHWILDDNIRDFRRLTDNVKMRVGDAAIFCAAEDFVDRYENVAISGFNYQWFAKQKQVIPPFVLNTRVYSCILIQNDIPYRWRGRYNEDTDLSLRALKDGWVTCQFNAFLADKMTTMTMKGGNTEDLYKIKDGRLKMAQSLQEQHPDVTKITKKWGRWQHQVDYRPFKKNKLILKPGVVIPDGADEYGLSLQVIGG